MAKLKQTATTPPKKKHHWVLLVLVLLVIGFPFMSYAFSPLPVMPQDAQLVGEPVLAVEGAAQPSLTVDSAELKQILSACPRARRPEKEKITDSEQLRLTFRMADAQGENVQDCEIRLYAGIMPDTLEGFFRYGSFSYPLQDATSLGKALTDAAMPLAG